MVFVNVIGCGFGNKCWVYEGDGLKKCDGKNWCDFGFL